MSEANLPADAPKSTKGVGTRLGLSNYLGLAGALAAMIALFSVLSTHFLTYDTFSTIANQIPDLVVMSAAARTGTVTGLVTVAWRIPSFIVSLGVLEAARGLAYQMTNSRTAYIGDAFDFLSNPIALGISPAFLIAVAVMIVAQLVLTRTVFGRYLVGIGTNEEAVRLAGVNPRPLQGIAVALIGGAAGL